MDKCEDCCDLHQYFKNALGRPLKYRSGRDLGECVLVCVCGGGGGRLRV